MRRFKKILVMTMTLVLLLSSTVFADDTETTVDVEGNLKTQVVEFLESNIYTLDKETAEYMKNNNVGYYAETCEGYIAVIDSLGEYKEVGEVTSDYDKDNKTYTVTVIGEFEESDLKAVVTVSEFSSGMGIEEVSFSLVSEDDSLAAKMTRAALNTLIGMGVVFLVLIFIAYLISLFKYIPGLVEAVSKAFSKKDNIQEVIELPTHTVEVVEQEELVEDKELVAVITAAIAASEQTSTDGFVVRSIKRTKKSRAY